MDNPHIIRIHDIFEENATAYYVMEYIEGDSLDRLIQKQGKLDTAVALNYICQTAKALQYIQDVYKRQTLWLSSVACSAVS